MTKLFRQTSSKTGSICSVEKGILHLHHARPPTTQNCHSCFSDDHSVDLLRQTSCRVLRKHRSTQRKWNHDEIVKYGMVPFLLASSSTKLNLNITSTQEVGNLNTYISEVMRYYLFLWNTFLPQISRALTLNEQSGKWSRESLRGIYSCSLFYFIDTST